MSNLRWSFEPSKLFDFFRRCHWCSMRDSGGARRDRTDDLMLAKHALSQLSYGPVESGARVARHSGTALMAFSPSIGPPDRSIALARNRRRSGGPGKT